MTKAGKIGIKISPNNFTNRCNGLPFFAAAALASSLDAVSTPVSFTNCLYTSSTVPGPITI